MLGSLVAVRGGFVEVVHSAVATDGVVVAKADASFVELGREIQESWRRMGGFEASEGHTEKMEKAKEKSWGYGV